MNLFNGKNFKTIYYKYYNLKKKWINNNANIWYNKTCKDKKITPKYAYSKNKSYNTRSKLASTHYAKLRLKNEINFLYKKKQQLNLLLYKAELQALDIFGKFWHHIKQLLLEKLSKFANTKYQNLNQKLSKLLKIKPVNIHEKDNFQFHEPIKNLSEEQFSDQELNLIAKGYKSNMSNKNNIEKLIVEAEHIIHTNEKLDKNEIRYQISQEIKKLKNQKISNNKTSDELIQVKQIKNIIKKIREKNLTVNIADKGNIITIENKDKLYQKTNTFLENPLYSKLKSDPTQKYQNEIKNLIKQSNLVINNKNNSLINSNPSAPKLRVNIKILKKDFPIRPIVNYKSAPAYNLQKQLVNILHEGKSCLVPNPRNSHKFCESESSRWIVVEIYRNRSHCSFSVRNSFWCEVYGFISKCFRIGEEKNVNSRSSIGRRGGYIPCSSIIPDFSILLYTSQKSEIISEDCNV